MSALPLSGRVSGRVPAGAVRRDFLAIVRTSSRSRRPPSSRVLDRPVRSHAESSRISSSSASPASCARALSSCRRASARSRSALALASRARCSASSARPVRVSAASRCSLTACARRCSSSRWRLRSAATRRPRVAANSNAPTTITRDHDDHNDHSSGHALYLLVSFNSEASRLTGAAKLCTGAGGPVRCSARDQPFAAEFRPGLLERDVGRREDHVGGLEAILLDRCPLSRTNSSKRVNASWKRCSSSAVARRHRVVV